VTLEAAWIHAVLQLKLSATDHEIHSAVAVLPSVVRDALGEFGKWVAFGLTYIEDISGGKANQDGARFWKIVDSLICAIFLYPQGK
jgi:hypothetical protein